MSLKGILSIVTYPGLYKHVAQAKNGLVIESIADGKRSLAYATSRISALEDISIYTSDGDTKLSEVYKNLYNELGGKKTPFNPKKASEKELTDLFTKALPDWDKDRVYLSDIKRAYSWYNLLVEKGYIDGKDEEPETAQEQPAKEEAEKEAEAAPKTRTRKSKAAAEAKPAAAEEESGEITVKKRTRKKKTTEEK
jgi:hypothetical protein